MSHWRGNVISSHEDGTKHQTTTENDSQRIGINRISQMHQTTENEYGNDDADWNMPGDDLLPEHVSQTEQEGESTNLASGSGTEGIAVAPKSRLMESGN